MSRPLGATLAPFGDACVSWIGVFHRLPGVIGKHTGCKQPAQEAVELDEAGTFAGCYGQTSWEDV